MAVLPQLRFDQGNPGRLGRQGTAPAAPQTTRTVQDPMAVVRFLQTAIDARLLEATRLAKTVETWWPAILIALTAAVSNAELNDRPRMRRAATSPLTAPTTSRCVRRGGSVIDGNRHIGPMSRVSKSLDVPPPRPGRRTGPDAANGPVPRPLPAANRGTRSARPETPTGPG